MSIGVLKSMSSMSSNSGFTYRLVIPRVDRSFQLYRPAAVHCVSTRGRVSDIRHLTASTIKPNVAIPALKCNSLPHKYFEISFDKECE